MKFLDAILKELETIADVDVQNNKLTVTVTAPTPYVAAQATSLALMAPNDGFVGDPIITESNHTLRIEVIV